MEDDISSIKVDSILKKIDEEYDIDRFRISEKEMLNQFYYLMLL